VLYQAQFDASAVGGKLNTGLFKIDTATGRVWKYQESPGKPVPQAGHLPQQDGQPSPASTLNARWEQVAPY
jgi:hypothetical protein